MSHSMSIQLWDQSAPSGEPATYQIEFTPMDGYMRIHVRPIEYDGRRKVFAARASMPLVKDMAKYFYAVAKSGGA